MRLANPPIHVVRRTLSRIAIAVASFGLGVLTLLGGAGCASAGEKTGGQAASAPVQRRSAKTITSIRTGSDLYQYLTWYYLHPNPDLIPEAIKQMNADRVFEKPSSRAPLSAFLATVFSKHPDKIAYWATLGEDGDPETQRALWMALWLSNRPEAVQYLRERQNTETELETESGEFLSRCLARPPRPLPTLSIEFPSDVDMLWGAFFASGDASYVNRIILAASWARAADTPDKLLSGAAAQATLTSNAKLHPRVMHALKDLQDVTTGDLQEVIAQVIGEAEGARPRSDPRAEAKAKLQAWQAAGKVKPPPARAAAGKAAADDDLPPTDSPAAGDSY